MSQVSRLCLAVATGVGLNAATPAPVPATPVDPEIMKQIGPRVAMSEKDREQLIEMGRELFFEETFDGNGRTCGTCHPADNNFTIDPEFIATLPNDDPLFVAEFNPDLEDLEKPELLREFGLILENVDGFDQPGVMRSVPHNLGMAMSIGSELPGTGHALGWSGDGSPGAGSLREFAVGAIKQHMPKTMAREAGVDFRLPTALELDAMEAFVLSLGRHQNVDLASMNFTDERVQHGMLLFNNEDGNDDRACSGCHSNAGASNDEGINGNFDTGTRHLTQAMVAKTDASAPPDGGFGTAALEDDSGHQGFGDGTMNTPSLMEAADTAPFFHNNSAATLEAAVEFYASETFANSPAGERGPFEFTQEDIEAVGAFLRTLNAIENIRNGNVISMDAQRSVPRLAEREIELVIAETEDAIAVLTGGPLPELYPDAVAELESALELEREALATEAPKPRNDLLQQASALKEDAREMMVEEQPAVAMSETE